jgi:hypothetical protein
VNNIWQAIEAFQFGKVLTTDGESFRGGLRLLVPKDNMKTVSRTISLNSTGCGRIQYLREISPLNATSNQPGPI